MRNVPDWAWYAYLYFIPIAIQLTFLPRYVYGMLKLEGRPKVSMWKRMNKKLWMQFLAFLFLPVANIGAAGVYWWLWYSRIYLKKGKLS